MGEETANNCGLSFTLLGNKIRGASSAEDTIHVMKEMAIRRVDLVLFAGGDGTARDVYKAVGCRQPVLGIPAGVKIHSGVYAQDPSRAGELALLFLQGRVRSFVDGEVMDIDEGAYRKGILAARLYGYLKIPFEKKYVQCAKSRSPRSERYHQEAIAHDVAEGMEDDVCYIVGPGTTTGAVMDHLKLAYSLLGVDVIMGRTLVGKDVNEKEILDIIRGKKARLILTPIGGQGYLLGRGNQQISPEVIRQVGKDRMIIVSTPMKIQGLGGNPLLVDTGDPELNGDLSGFFQVITGYHQKIVYPVG
jgi:predicted polyphosphate/ATP-dependent NAD kinase